MNFEIKKEDGDTFYVTVDESVIEETKSIGIDVVGEIKEAIYNYKESDKNENSST